MLKSVLSFFSGHWRWFALAGLAIALLALLLGTVRAFGGIMDRQLAAGIRQGSAIERVAWQDAAIKARDAALETERARVKRVADAMEAFRAEQIRVRVIRVPITRKVVEYAQSPAGSVLAFDADGVRALRESYDAGRVRQSARTDPR